MSRLVVHHKYETKGPYLDNNLCLFLPDSCRPRKNNVSVACKEFF